MKTGWMVDVLTDLEKFAELNDMDELREQLAQCRELAVEAEDGQEDTSPDQPMKR